MEKITCDVIQDILPLYCDDVCSKDSRELVKKHLEGCQECSELLEKMKKECVLADKEEQGHETVVKEMAATWRRSIKRSFVYGVLIMLCICGILTGSYLALTRLILVTIPADRMEITVENVTEQYVELSLKSKDGKKVFGSSSQITADGKYYIVMERGVIATENGIGENWEGTFTISRSGYLASGERVPVTEIYYGTGKDSVLIWEADTDSQQFP